MNMHMDDHDELPFRSDGEDIQKLQKLLDRRTFLTKTSMGLGALALGSLLGVDRLKASNSLPWAGNVFRRP